jgi:hypothetical protein
MSRREVEDRRARWWCFFFFFFFTFVLLGYSYGVANGVEQKSRRRDGVEDRAEMRKQLRES